MGIVVVCSPTPPDISGTVLSRDGLEELKISRPDQALGLADARPALVLIDVTFPGAAGVARSFRARCPVVAIAHEEFSAVEVDLLAAGVVAVLRPPAGPDWDVKLRPALGCEVRGDSRRSASFPVAVVSRGGHGEAVVATMVDLSRSGMLLESSVTLDVGDDVLFSFRLPGARPLVTGAGAIVRQVSSGRFAIRFGHVDEGRAHISSFLEQGPPAENVPEGRKRLG